MLFLTLPVFIQTPKGTTFFLETQPSYTVGHIKSMIQERKGVPSDELKLKFADLLLEDDHCTLSDYNIQDGSTVILYYRTGKLPWLFRYYYPPSSCHTGESALKIGLIIGKDPH